MASKTSKDTSAQNVHFVDGDMPWTYDIAATPDATSTLNGFSDAQLGDFLSRPLKVQEYQWAPQSQLFQVFNPWVDFFGNADVKQKINRYRNLRCNLKMKVLVNGNSFYYGRAMLSYNPYLSNDSVTKNRAFFIQDLVQASQKPHILLDPCTSQGGEMTLPFIWPENYLDITQPSWVNEMGRVTIHDFDVLQHANGGTDPITVSIFVWVENLTLAVPTTSQVQSGSSDRELDEFGFPKPYVEQAGKKTPRKANNSSNNDEFTKDGLISKPASAIVSAANALTMIPMIAPYAKATCMVAGKIGQMAKIFGYSRPQVVEDTHNYVPRYVGNMCNSDAPEPLVKLSLDSKNELSIDTRVMGLGGADEMTINSIAQRPSFWRQFDWPESATADSLLTSMMVMPAYNQTLVASPVTEIHMTALAFAAAPFATWQGSIKFRFNVVCSEYHRGRLRIVYNPVGSPAGPIPFNQVYSTIIDISEDRDFEYEVKWADIRAFAAHYGPEAYPILPLYDDVNPVGGGTIYDNGTLSVYVVNELATPSVSAADVKIQVWVSGGDDFAVAVPTTNGLENLSLFQQQSDAAPEVLAETKDASNAPTSSMPIDSFGDSSDMIPDDNQYLVYQGERILSFRELLRRYQYHNSYWPNDTGLGYRLVTQDLTDFPFYRGWDPNGQDSALNSTALISSYNYCTMTLINWLTPAYACRRGGLRHKALLIGDSSSSESTSFTVSRHLLDGTANKATSHSLSSALPGDRRSKIQETLRGSLGGTHVTPTQNNPCLEYETPFYTIGQRFVSARDLDYYDGFHAGHELATEVTDTAGPSGDPARIRIDKYVSIAEDFQLGMFVGAPILYAYQNPTPVQVDLWVRSCHLDIKQRTNPTRVEYSTASVGEGKTMCFVLSQTLVVFALVYRVSNSLQNYLKMIRRLFIV